ncbi:hypothetical protein FPSE_08302 [Fusarium pseudograminearum CS3096]|uniref:Uncharacterized protein n=1 Tax=Fusarium pseudograminearum (strain CS3096) TaxID=1028729 RepID=K3VCR9_FUSPC|nr:hypothetical protein FPSE_08302 [Fusarium pseudograminearum CS3096]EKJ71489.1 hypothetical protein FPSE_08302 [Fusarium pseudograminearum CS3096]
MAVRLLVALPWLRDSFELRIHGSWVAVLYFFSADPFVDYREGQVPRLVRWLIKVPLALAGGLTRHCDFFSKGIKDVKPAGTADGKGSGPREQNCVVYRLCQYCANSAVSVVQCLGPLSNQAGYTESGIR